MQSFFEWRGTIKWPDIGGVIAVWQASDGDGRPFGGEINADIADVFVIAKQDVIAWQVAFNHLVFEE